MMASVNAVAQGQPPGSLLVFSDDWGRHPSSCQHLVKQLLDQYAVLWVNTIGTRAPRLDMATASRVLEKVKQWAGLERQNDADLDPALAHFRRQHARFSHPGLQVVNPRMWPWFAGPFDRALNRRLLAKQLIPLIEKLPQPVCALTTLPITADLPGVLPVDRWLYYCVDDFSQWPGLDQATLRRMDVDMMARADSLVAVSENLQQMIASEGRSSALLTHGVDVEFWKGATSSGQQHPARPQLIPSGAVVFWGVIDRRMDVRSIEWLSRDLATEDHRTGAEPRRIVLIGPQQDPDPGLLQLPNVMTIPPQPLEHLPKIAAEASVLIMPYADLPVTRAMQPLKLKEYLATGKPVVVNELPSTKAWHKSLDTAGSPQEFSALVRMRIREGISTEQQADRLRLADESWAAKASRLNQIVCAPRGKRPDSQAWQRTISDLVPMGAETLG